MKLVYTILLLTAIIGCKAKPYLAGKGATDLARAQSTFAAAAANVDAAKPHADATGQELLTVAQDQHALGQEQLAGAAKEMNRMQKSILDVTNRLNYWLDSFWSYRQIKYFWIIVGGATLVWLILGFLSIYLPVGGVGSSIIRALPLMNPFAWVRDQLVKPGTLTKTPRAAG